MTAPDSQWISVATVADHFNITHQHVYQLARRRHWRRKRRGKEVLYYVLDVLDTPWRR
ncbi:MAG: hypothetical protein Q7V58_09530 [Actinomycetota bacterium]|nr:hypothetical protein [Actinomycetota bacterium]